MTNFSGSEGSDIIVTDSDSWSIEQAEDTYHISHWGESYFFVNEKGHVAVRPIHNETVSIDIYDIVRSLKEDGTTFPVLIRFQDLLQSRVVQLNEAFRKAIKEYDFENVYTGVFPVKVNQLHEVVEEILEAGKPYGFGLECGSKAELIAALPHLEDDETLLICNGYKDAVMMRLMLHGQRLGKNVIPVLEKYGELDALLRLASEMGIRPQFGVRVRLSTTGAGKWAESGGDQSKFGISIPELLNLIERLEDEELTDAFKLVHFHLGSQIANIQNLKQAVKEITRVYTQLRHRNIPVKYLDVGGGLGVNYEAGSENAPEGINYTLQEYVNSVVYAVKEVCDSEEVPHPVLVSESGRAITAHHSVLIVEVMGAYTKNEIHPDFAPGPDEHDIVRELYDMMMLVQRGAERRNGIKLPHLLETYHDAVEKRQQADLLFSFGYLTLEQKATAERLYWSICRAINERVMQIDPEWLPTDFETLKNQLVDQYLCDFSVFQSMLDHWAIGQIFPIMPVHRLDEEPLRRGTLVDLTCDSDGRVDRFVFPGSEKRYLELHHVGEDDRYFLGFFLMGAYQDIMGDMHNLFGRVTEVHVYVDAEEPENYYIEKTIPGTRVEDILALVQYFPNDLIRRMDKLIQKKVKAGKLRPKAGVELLEQYRKSFQEFTYLNTESVSPSGKR